MERRGLILLLVLCLIFCGCSQGEGTQQESVQNDEAAKDAAADAANLLTVGDHSLPFKVARLFVLSQKHQYETAFGSSIWLAKEFESEPGHYYLFYGDGSGASCDPETKKAIPFTYEMESADCAMFHFCSAEDMSPAGVHWLSDTAVQLTWHSGTVLTLNYVQAYDPDFQP